jgi:hypothetical protein
MYTYLFECLLLLWVHLLGLVYVQSRKFNIFQVKCPIYNDPILWKQWFLTALVVQVVLHLFAIYIFSVGHLQDKTAG